MTTRIEATRLVPGRGDVVDDGVVLMDDDVICVSGDPTSDVAVLAEPANVTHVFKGGVRYKG